MAGSSRPGRARLDPRLVAGDDPHRHARDTHGDPAVQPVAADSGTASVADDSTALVAAVRISASVSVAIAAVSVALLVVRVAIALGIREPVQLGQPEPVAVRRHAGRIGISQCGSSDDQLPAVAPRARNWADESGPTCYSSLYDAVAGDVAERSTSLGADLSRAGRFPGLPGEPAVTPLVRASRVRTSLVNRSTII